MPSYLDLAVIGVVLISALLSMMRGFTREVLAIASWAAAAVAAYYLYQRVVPYLEPYIHKPAIAQAVAAAIVFFITLIVVSLITVRISDFILDSKGFGALDRTLGFIFGAVRGFLLMVVAFAIYNWLVGDKLGPDWVKNAKTRPVLTETADRIIAMLPEDAAATLETWIKSKTAPPANDAPADESQTPAPPASPTPTPAKKADVAPSPSPTTDKTKLDALINKLPLPPAAGAPVLPSASPTPAKPKG